jgi:hypothetical protein
MDEISGESFTLVDSDSLTYNIITFDSSDALTAIDCKNHEYNFVREVDSVDTTYSDWLTFD